jgi:hypothetical protein
MSIAIKLLLTILTTTTPTSVEVHDLCDVVHRETEAPTICQPHEEGAPVFDANVCCAGRSCFKTTAGCQTGESLYYCELGEASATGEVSCYFEVQSYCDVHPCVVEYVPFPQKGSICCSQGICWDHVIGSDSCELNDIYFCGSVVCNADGTVTCIDWE